VLRKKNIKSDNDIVHFNIKLDRNVRELFKKNVKEYHNITMQEALSAFILSFNQNPRQFQIQTILGVKGNGPEQAARETQPKN